MRCNMKLIAASVTVLAAAGCAPVDPGFGESYRYDMAIQTVDPDPVYADDAMKPGYHGEKAAKASERYRKGSTKPVQRESTNTAQSGGGSGASSGPQ